ncbi:MAG: HAMP domain-containing histidine kinase [Hyphomicrobiales bacterium]|nr:HAMP domain-containing histidine kinase [Hyphomicrobiales bacterium]
MLDEIARLLDQLSAIGDNIAHDLRSPLADVRIKIEKAVHSEDLPVGQRDALRAALKQIDRSMLTIAALLRASAVESGRRMSAFRQIDLSNVCEDVFEFYHPIAQAKGVDMTLHAAASVSIRGDFDLMREAVANIVDNAVKFTGSGGSVRIQCATENGLARIAISDTGCGIAQEEQAAIFDRFARGSNREPADGYGIGLSIAKTIARLHGMNVSVESDGHGATFVMRGGLVRHANAEQDLLANQQPVARLRIA